jgi:hypothetical protein
LNKIEYILCALGVLALCSCGAQPSAGSEEFAGPFPSWRNLKTDYGAVGDGKADDTAMLQRALDDLTAHKDFCVLYIPAGKYRLTGTVKTLRKAHTECQGIAIVGESPGDTILRWDGPAGETVFQYDAWLSKISRLTIDGAGRAGVALYYGPSFSTFNETSDLILRDAGIGILFGGAKTQGQAENEVLRCRFLNCSDAGIETANFNSADIWVWYSRFEDCGHALFNAAGNFHAWQNLFLRSRVADIGTRNLLFFSFVNNTSIGSRRFLDFDTVHEWGAQMTISGNRILDPTGDFPLKLGNAGPYLVMDNLFKLPPGSGNQAVKMTWGDQTFVGNIYTTTNAVRENGRFRRVAEKVVDGRGLDETPPVLPSTPAPGHRKTIEVPAGAGSDAIQRALDEAGQLRGQRPVVHLPVGIYKIAKTLVIPAESDVQLVGDSAGETGSCLIWTGERGGLLLKLEGPARATLRDLYLRATDARAILVENADQPGGRIFTDQLNVSGPFEKTNTSASALLVNGLAQTDVLLRCLQGSGNSGTWVQVAGSAFTNVPSSKNQISIFTGSTSSAEGQYEVRNGGNLVVRGVYHEKSGDTLRGIYLSDSGTLAIDASKFACKTSPQAPFVTLDNFRGLFTLATSMLVPVDSTNICRFELTGDGSQTEALILDDMFWALEPGVTTEKVWLNKAVPPAHGGLAGCNLNSPEPMKSRFAFLDDTMPPPSDAELLRGLAPLREARVWLPDATPAHVTDLRLYRLMIRGGVGGGATVEFTAKQGG